MRKIDIYTINEGIEALPLVKESDYRELEGKLEISINALKQISFYARVNHDKVSDYGDVADQALGKVQS